MKKLSIKRVRRFFDINGLDVLEGEKIEVSEVINGIEYCSLEEVCKVMTTFTTLFGGLVKFCNTKK